MTAFVDVAVIPMDTERVLPNHTVVVEGGRIAMVGPSDKVKVPKSAVRIDGRDKFLIPGLADMHTHLGWMSIMGAPVPAPDDTVDPKVQRLLLGILRSGVTTVRNMEMENPPAKRALWLRNQLMAGKVLGPRMYTSGPWRILRDDTVTIHQQVVAYKVAGYDFIKIYGADGEAFDSLMAAARREGLPVAGHIPEDISVRQALTAGMKSIEHLYGYHPIIGGKLYQAPALEPGLTGKPGDSVLVALAAATQRAGTWNCTVEPNVQARLPELRARVIKALQDAGAGLLACTDNSGGPGTGVHGNLAELVQAGLTPYQALVAGTRNPGEYFGLLDSAGTIAVGKRADLVLLHGNPLDNIANTVQSAGVMLGGRWLAREEIEQRQLALGRVEP